ALAAVPYGLWAIPALVAQLRFDEPATVDAVERIALAASFLAGAIDPRRGVRVPRSPAHAGRADARARRARRVRDGGGRAPVLLRTAARRGTGVGIGARAGFDRAAALARLGRDAPSAARSAELAPTRDGVERHRAARAALRSGRNERRVADDRRRERER